MKKKIAVLGTLDTKGQELFFIRDIIKGANVDAVVIDTGVMESSFQADISNEDVARAGGGVLKDLVEAGDRGKAVNTMMRGSAEVVVDLYQKGEIHGVVALGGSAGTTIASYAMRALPVGVPKLMVSTMASGDTQPYVGTKDITMMFSIVDISGINTISCQILSNAANAVIGMVTGKVEASKDQKPLIGATMFGVTTPCVTAAQEYLESLGYEVLVFHATGTGGRAMETLIESGFFEGILDITTTEIADEVVGGVLSAGPERLDIAAKIGVPQVVSTGALDMVNFRAVDSMPAQFKDRLIYEHNATVTLMRTSAEENKQIGEMIASKLNKATGPASLFLPRKGVSMIDVEGQPFYDPEADAALFSAIKENVDSSNIEIIEMDNALNDEFFALAMAKKLDHMIKRR